MATVPSRGRFVRSGAGIVLLVLLAAGAAPGAEDAFQAYAQAVKRALRSEDPEVRQGAFDVLRDCAHPEAVDLVLRSVRDLEREQERIRQEQAKEESRYEKMITDLEELNAWFLSSSKSSRDLDRYNKQERKISRQRDAVLLRLKNLENDFTRIRALLDAAVRAVGRVLANLRPEDLGGALANLDESWLLSRATADRLRWLDAIAELDRPTVPERIRDAVGNATLPLEVRAPALTALAERRDPAALDLALAHLHSPDAEWALAAASIGALRRLHDRRAIEPLIAFLGREDITRLREDAHEALKSLTGERHGPYREPWERWWEENADTFQMPEAPSATAVEREQRPGVTFYGIHTFSDRILFIVDVSGSMDQTPRPAPGEPPGLPKMAVARRELVGAIASLDEDALFNVVLFNHEVFTWNGQMVKASESAKRRVQTWIQSQEPLGGTNIHDALETGFQIATRTTGRPNVDTVFFLTDGRPTAGKIKDPDRILDVVRDWNRTAQLRVHCIGIGDHDESFLRDLAAIGGGRYEKR